MVWVPDDMVYVVVVPKLKVCDSSLLVPLIIARNVYGEPENAGVPPLKVIL
jgi:hypothetical protein